jgi:phosphoribosyl-AMP cyclohydrolase
MALRKGGFRMLKELKYDEKGLIPAIIQDINTGEVLMMAYMNENSLRMTLETGYTHFWSRSRQKYWKKGETSGNVQEVKEILVDCDNDTLLIKVIQHGSGACHTGNRTCFYRDIKRLEAEG